MCTPWWLSRAPRSPHPAPRRQPTHLPFSRLSIAISSVLPLLCARVPETCPRSPTGIRPLLTTAQAPLLFPQWRRAHTLRPTPHRHPGTVRRLPRPPHHARRPPNLCSSQSQQGSSQAGLRPGPPPNRALRPTVSSSCTSRLCLSGTGHRCHAQSLWPPPPPGTRCRQQAWDRSPNPPHPRPRPRPRPRWPPPRNERAHGRGRRARFRGKRLRHRWTRWVWRCWSIDAWQPRAG